MAGLDLRNYRIGLGIASMLAPGCADDTTATPPGDTGTSTGGMESGPGTADSDTAPASTDAADVEPDTTAGEGSSTGGETSSSSGMTEADSSSTGPGNQPPVAHHDPYAIALGTASLMVDAGDGVLDNDRDPEGDPLTVSDSDAASALGGTVSVEADGAFTYTPPADIWGEDSFGYTIDDGQGNTADGVVNIAIAPATVSLSEIGGGHYGFRIDGAVEAGAAGRAVATGGDVNGDGRDDIVVASDVGVGRVWVVFGKDDGTPVNLDDVEAGIGGFVITGAAIDEGFGAAVDGGGDFNGDGLDDIVIGAPQTGFAGAAYLIHGKADGAEVLLADVIAGTADGFAMSGQVMGDDAGAAVAMLGDVNGDGLADIAVGAPDAGTVPGAGRTYVVHGTATTDPITLSDVQAGQGGFAINGEGVDDASGTEIAGGGDVNGDGLADIVIGARLANPNGGNSGAAYVVFGKTDNGTVGLINGGNASFSIHGITGLDQAGISVDNAGDVNGDGRDDIVVGADGADDDLSFQGQSYVVFGKGTGTDVELSDVLAGNGGFGIDGEVAGHLLGQAVAGLGDVNGDGFSDLLLGAANVDLAGTNAGRAHLVFGKGNGARVELAAVSAGVGGWAMDGVAGNDRAGIAVARGGDIDGDGYADMLISADGSDEGGSNAGSVYVVFGAAWTGAVGYLGGSGSDSFVGAPANEGMVAGAGDDVVAGGGGSDVLYCGLGDDQVSIVAGQFFRIDGGAGSDTLAVADADVVLNLGVIANNAVRNIETIDLTGQGDNDLIMLAVDIRAMVGPDRTLTVIGDAGDTADIDLSGGTWAAGASAGGFDTYSDGAFILRVSTDIESDITLL